MTSPALSLQQAIRGACVADPGVSTLVPAANIYDRSKRPEVFPSIVLGEDFEQSADMTLARDMVRVTSTVHIWSREPSSVGVKNIAAAIRSAVTSRVAGFIDVRFESARFLRDPDGETQHAVLTFESLVWSPV